MEGRCIIVTRPFMAVGLLGVWAWAGAAAALAVDEDFVLAMPFDEGQGDVANDLSLGEHHGTLMGPTWEEGRFGGGLHFDAAGP